MKEKDGIGKSNIKKYTAYYKYLVLFSENKEDENIVNYNQDFFSDMHADIKEVPKLRYIQNKLHLKPDEIIESFKDEKDKLSNSYTNEMFRFFNNLFKFFNARRYTEFEDINFIQGKHKTITKLPFNSFELEELMEKIEEPLYKAVFRVALYTGMRTIEIANLKKKNIDVENGFSIIDRDMSKTDAGQRIIPIHKNIIEVLTDLKNTSPNNYIFEKDGNETNLNKKVNRRIEDFVKDSRKRLHGFRKNFIQELYRQQKDFNIDDKTIKLLAGHATNDITFDIYNLRQIPTKHLKEAIDSIEFVY